MPNNPDELDELEEIKKLISVDYSKSPKDPAHTGTELSAPVSLTTRRRPEADKQVSGVPAVRQKPGMPQVKSSPGLPATPRRPGMLQPKPPPGVLSVSQKPDPPKVKVSPGIPAAQQKRSVPAQSRRPVTPASSEKDEQIHSYNISASGKISETGADETEPDIGDEDFKVKFDFEEAYRDVPENRPLRMRRERRTGCVGGILYSAFVICISIIIASLMWLAAVDVLGFGAENEQVNVIVPKDFSMEEITDMLYDAGLIKYKFLFNIYSGFSKAEEKITAGSYILNMNFDYRALVQGMTARAGVRVETTVPIPEGYTLSQIFARLVDYGVCQTEDELWEAAKNYDFKYSFLDESTLGDKLRLEGFMFPNTYNFYIDSTPVQAISKFLNEFDRRFTETYVDRAKDMGYSVRDIINIASMIEREAGSDEERPRIAAVIYNRLKSKDFPYIQIDATIVYALAGTDIPFSTDYDSPYNTYLYENLPPGPIANPGMPSIRAALYPDSTNEYYYALNTSGTHNFFRTNAQHQAFVKSNEYGGR